MIPTLLLVVAAVVTMAAPAKAAQQPSSLSLDEFVVVETEIGPIQTVVVR